MKKQHVMILLVIVFAIIGIMLISYFFVDVIPPTAKIKCEKFTHVGESVRFDGGDSSDNAGIISYEWKFGDGDTGTGRICMHTYSTVGMYTVTLSVKDKGGNSATATTTIFVSYHHPLKMHLKSEDFTNNSRIPSRFTCDGENISPKLTWENVPVGTKSFAITVIDPDAPGGEFIHWLICDIPGNIRSIDRGKVPPEAKEFMNDAGRPGYTGPCPPRSSTHRYIFTIYALDVENLADISKENFREVVWIHALDKAVLVGLYQRSS